MICIIDYGIGNIGSVKNMFKKLGTEVCVTSKAEQLMNATHIILPGVGRFDACMQAFNESGLRDVLAEKVLSQKIPILGICVGYQMLTRSSQEGVMPGLGWLNAETVKFSSPDLKYKIPHMGWNEIKANKNIQFASDFENDFEECRAYFVHSYYVQADTESDVMFTTNYIHNFASGMKSNNIYGVQFHPEKSHKFGLKLFKVFAGLGHDS